MTKPMTLTELLKKLAPLVSLGTQSTRLDWALTSLQKSYTSVASVDTKGGNLAVQKSSAEEVDERGSPLT